MPRAMLFTSITSATKPAIFSVSLSLMFRPTKDTDLAFELSPYILGVLLFSSCERCRSKYNFSNQLKSLYICISKTLDIHKKLPL